MALVQENISKRIEVRLRDLGQLFNTMDPSPFHDKDLDQDAEEYIESWAQEFPVKERVMLVIHLADWPAEQDTQTLVAQAIHNFSATRLGSTSGNCGDSCSRDGGVC